MQDCEQHLFNLGDLGVIWVLKHVEASGDKHAHEIFLHFLLIPQILNVLLENVLKMLERLDLKHLNLVKNLCSVGKLVFTSLLFHSRAPLGARFLVARLSVVRVLTLFEFAVVLQEPGNEVHIGFQGIAIKVEVRLASPITTG